MKTPLLLGLATGFALSGSAATYTVTTPAASGEGSLKQAIMDSNASIGVPDTIEFNLPGGGVQTIKLSANLLPTITDPVVIDGTTQPGYVGTPLVFLDGTGARNVAGLIITAGNTIVRGLAIGRVGRSGSPGGSGLLLQDGANNRVEACFIGVDPTGSVGAFNRNGGILISNSVANIIGGPAPAQHNVIAGNSIAGVVIGGTAASNNVVAGNFIGLAADGATRLGNTSGIFITDGASGNRIGGSGPGERNVIAGNFDANVDLQRGASGNAIQGNFIGSLRADGTVLALTNPNDANDFGVRIADSPNNVIGGATAGTGNVISGNNQDGILISGAASTGTVIQGNLIGTDPAGGTAVPNGTGVLVLGADGVVVGGPTLGARNVISASSNDGVYLVDVSNALVQGNLIGTDATGRIALGNGHTNSFGGGGSGISLGALNKSVTNNLFGGAAAGAGNVISGNLWVGFAISGNKAVSNTIQGNFIGTDVTGTNALGNLQDGLDVYGAANTRIGGGTPGAGNVISANGGAGILLGSYFGLAASNTVIAGNRIGLGAVFNHPASFVNRRGVARSAGLSSLIPVLLSNGGTGIFNLFADLTLIGDEDDRDGRDDDGFDDDERRGENYHYQGGGGPNHMDAAVVRGRRGLPESGPGTVVADISVAGGTVALLRAVFIGSAPHQVYGSTQPNSPTPPVFKTVERAPQGGIRVAGEISGLAPNSPVTVELYGDVHPNGGLFYRLPLFESAAGVAWIGMTDPNGKAAFRSTVFDFETDSTGAIESVTGTVTLDEKITSLFSADFPVTTVTSGIPTFTGFARVEGGLKLTWLGNPDLQTADNLAGPWSKVPGAVSPFTAPFGEKPTALFRLKATAP